MDTAYFASGCFWCSEALFSRLRGVAQVVPGYAGGDMDNPHYEDLISKNTGHSETIKVIFDPKVINYDTLLDVFWNTHDPTSFDRQGADVGQPYRSLIFYTSPEQKQAAETSRQSIQSNYPQPIVTQIKPFTNFYPAEDYHHDYYKNHPNLPYCRVVIEPKLQKFLKTYRGKVKGG